MVCGFPQPEGKAGILAPWGEAGAGVGRACLAGRADMEEFLAPEGLRLGSCKQMGGYRLLIPSWWGRWRYSAGPG